ncbi:MAG: URC4/urg3 family protein [Casimicrobiaceae bacterium]
MTSAQVADPPVETLLSPAAIRARSNNILAAALAGRTRHFRVDRSRLDGAAATVERVTRRRYPSLAIPYHSRWRHFEAGGVDRKAQLTGALAGRDVAAAARARIDLAVVSVLLDAGSGPDWAYVETETGQRFTRSEGLGVASFRAFCAGAFSCERADPLRVDAAALAQVDAASLARWLQVRDDNPLVGLEGRAALLRRLGEALAAQRGTFGQAARPGGLFDTLGARGGGTVGAATLLRALLDGMGGIWLAGNRVDGVALGDAWRHPCAGGVGPSAGWVPFHKLSQWLAYSLFEPFEWAGVRVVDQDALTGLPEYRNGGLLLDSAVLALVDPAAVRAVHDIGSELVVEWRALTVGLLDEVATRVRGRLGRPDLPLACVLEGGTWAAGRELAQDLRRGDPPLAIRSDGTVF